MIIWFVATYLFIFWKQNKLKHKSFLRKLRFKVSCSICDKMSNHRYWHIASTISFGNTIKNKSSQYVIKARRTFVFLCLMFNNSNCLNLGFLEAEMSGTDNTAILAMAENIPLWRFSDNYDDYNDIFTLVTVAAKSECYTSYQKELERKTKGTLAATGSCKCVKQNISSIRNSAVQYQTRLTWEQAGSLRLTSRCLLGSNWSWSEVSSGTGSPGMKSRGWAETWRW